MNRIIFKESNKCYLCVDVILYIFITIIGFIILFSNCLRSQMLYNLYSIFYLIAILTLIAYFINRRKNDYELLLFCLINVFVGTFALLNYNYFDEYVILSLSIFMHTICNTANKWYHAVLLNEKNDPFVVSKSSMTFLLAMLGLFVSISFYSKSLIAHEFLGYYFIALGLLSLLEPFMKILIKNSTINRYLMEYKKEENKENIRVTTRKKVKPVLENKKDVKPKKKLTTKKNNVKEK